MHKLIDAYKICNSLTNARKIVAHARNHPMVIGLLPEADIWLVDEAFRLVERELVLRLSPRRADPEGDLI